MIQRELREKILMALPPYCRLFTNATGAYRSGTRFIRHGLIQGSADLIGWTVIERDGQAHGVFTAIELKRSKNDKPTALQLNFINAVNAAGGIALVAWEVKQAIDYINERRCEKMG